MAKKKAAAKKVATKKAAAPRSRGRAAQVETTATAASLSKKELREQRKWGK